MGGGGGGGDEKGREWEMKGRFHCWGLEVWGRK